jgi:hypothetical protein
MLERFQMVTPEKIEFINSLMKKSGRTRDLFAFLEANHCVNNDFTQRFFQLPTNLHAQNLIAKLDELHNEGKLSLVSYEWTILPEQKLSLLLVASTDSIEITVE